MLFKPEENDDATAAEKRKPRSLRAVSSAWCR